MMLKSLIKKLLPRPILVAYRSRNERLKARKYAGLSAAETFSRIYSTSTWGDGEFNSGPGSRDEAMVGPYVSAIHDFCTAQDRPLNAVDLGCGDFSVGSRIRGCFANYVARDVAPALIERNRREFAALDVDFDTLDMIDDALPAGDLVMIRQVLQHLSNAQISRVVAKLGQYKFAIITEHLPGLERFTPNLDKPMGDGIRSGLFSGVVLTAAPFGLKPLSERVICEVQDTCNPETIIRTTLYELAG